MLRLGHAPLRCFAEEPEGGKGIPFHAPAIVLQQGVVVHGGRQRLRGGAPQPFGAAGGVGRDAVAGEQAHAQFVLGQRVAVRRIAFEQEDVDLAAKAIVPVILPAGLGPVAAEYR